jgi:hypothetical protein
MAYIGTSPTQGVRRIYNYTATASQTSFSGNDTLGISLAYADGAYIDVYQNGVLLIPTDYVATTGTTVVLDTAAAVNDTVQMVVYDVFGVADSVSAKDGGGFAGNISSPIVTGSTSLRTPLIEFTDGDDAIAIADGGVVTLLTTAVAKSEGAAVTTNIAQGLAKSWVNMNGTGTIALRDSFNVSGIADMGGGDYVISITNDMANANYTLGWNQQADTTPGESCFVGLRSASGTPTTKLAGSYRGLSVDQAGNISDMQQFGCMVAGDLA